MTIIPEDYRVWCEEIEDALDELRYNKKKIAFNPMAGFWWVYK